MKRFNFTIPLFWIAAAICITASILMGASIGPQPVNGNLPVYGPAGYSTIGQGVVSLTGGTGGLCLSGTAATSIPCNQVILSVTGTGVLVGTGSGAGYLSVSPSNTLTLPCSNVNQIYVSGGTTGVKAGYLYFQ